MAEQKLCQAPLEYASNSFFPRLSPQRGLCAFIVQTQPDEALLAGRRESLGMRLYASRASWNTACTSRDRGPHEVDPCRGLMDGWGAHGHLYMHRGTLLQVLIIVSSYKTV